MQFLFLQHVDASKPYAITFVNEIVSLIIYVKEGKLCMVIDKFNFQKLNL